MINAKNMKLITGFFMEGKDVIEAFQGADKYRMRAEELSLYEKHGTKCRRWGRSSV